MAGDRKMSWVWTVTLLLQLASSGICSELEVVDGDLQIFNPTAETYQPECQSPLGMHSGKIPDSAISASSVYDKSVAPHLARLQTEVLGGAWCSKNMVDANAYEWLQIDLGKVKLVTYIETQGRFGGGQGMEFVTLYRLEYQRELNGTWRRYRNIRGEEEFQGNTDTSTVTNRKIHPPIIAQRIRIVPLSKHQRTICLRAELYGCQWLDGVMSYSMPQGEARGSNIVFDDSTYDGIERRNILSGGLGQLTDGEEGSMNFRIDSAGLGRKGFDWVGWKNETRSEPVSIEFEFDQLRVFTSVQIHSCNQFEKSVRVFRQARLYFTEGTDFSSEPLIFNHMRDDSLEFPRSIFIEIDDRIAKRVKLELTFDAKWMLISEVHFSSVPALEVAIETFPPEPPKVSPTVPSTPKPTEIQTPRTQWAYPTKSEATTKHGPLSEIPVGIQEEPESKDKNKEHVVPPTDDGIEREHGGNDRTLDEEQIGIIIGCMAAILLILFGIASFIVLKHQRKRADEDEDDEDDFVLYGKNQLKNSKPSWGTESKACTVPLTSEKATLNDAVESPSTPLFVKLPPEPIFQNLSNHAKEGSPEHQSKRTNDLSSFGHGNAKERASHHRLARTNPFLNDVAVQDKSVPPIMPPPAPLVPSMDINNSVLDEDIRSLRRTLGEFPRHSLDFLEKLGDGQYGEVQICRASLGSSQHLVVVKLLGSGDTQSQAHFLQEARILASLQDPGLCRVLGVCSSVGVSNASTVPLMLVLEYGQQGDLVNYLNRHNLVDQSSTQYTISFGDLLSIAAQIASAMKYLESVNMVHRDLAARNCLVGPDCSIKLCNLARDCDKFATDYHCVQGRVKLPIRWMAWESMLTGDFSIASDAWSFGVTLWEILSLARERPFSALTDQQVVQNAGLFSQPAHSDASTPTMPPSGAIVLPKAAHCPADIYSLMLECWSSDPSRRPGFREIHMFLQRKSLSWQENHAGKIII